MVPSLRLIRSSARPSVVLPEPDSPTTPSVRLRRMSIETPSTAFTQLRGSLRTVSKLCRPRFTAAARPRFGYPHLFDAGNLTREGRISDDELSRHRRAGDRLWHTDSSFIASHARDIVGMARAEGRALLAELIEFATQPQFTFRHTWRPGDLVMWDNFSTMHRGGEYDDVNERRDMRRTTVMAWPPPPIVLDPRFADRFDPAQFEAMVHG